MTQHQRRDYGEGNVRQRKTGSWEGRFYADGKRRSIYGKTEKDVKRKLRQALASAERGEVPTNQRITVEQYLMDWIENIARPRLRPRTVASYAQIIEGHLIPVLGKIKLSKLSRFDVTRFGAKTIAYAAHDRGLKVINHSFTTDLNIAASLALLSAVPEAHLFEHCVEDSPLREELARNPIRPVDGYVTVLEVLGQGVEIDPPVVERLVVAI